MIPLNKEEVELIQLLTNRLVTLIIKGSPSRSSCLAYRSAYRERAFPHEKCPGYTYWLGFRIIK